MYIIFTEIVGNIAYKYIYLLILNSLFQIYIIVFTKANLFLLILTNILFFIVYTPFSYLFPIYNFILTSIQLL